jgi:hypothetical protein
MNENNINICDLYINLSLFPKPLIILTYNLYPRLISDEREIKTKLGEWEGKQKRGKNLIKY